MHLSHSSLVPHFCAIIMAAEAAAFQSRFAFNNLPPSPLTAPSSRLRPPQHFVASSPAVRTRNPETVITPWFPMKKSDLDLVGATLDAGVELQADHPGFKDMEYRARRDKITAGAASYRHGDDLPIVDYTQREIETWDTLYKSLRQLSRRHAISTYNDIVDDMERGGIFGHASIPQMGDISAYLNTKTGFTLRPIAGLMTPRDFLNGLAFKVFHSTQYIRHHSMPLYTPEPDVVHELVGHVPMFADPYFAALSQKIGLASLSASDFEIKRLATAYWFSVEFGLCREKGQVKAYGAGLLSSLGELAFSCGESTEQDKGCPEYREFDPAAASLHSYPITSYQPLYYVSESLADAEAKIEAFGASLTGRGFSVSYDVTRDMVITDRPLQRMPKDPLP